MALHRVGQAVETRAHDDVAWSNHWPELTHFGTVPVLDIPFDEYLEKSPRQVATALAENRIAVVRGHGVYACGKTLNLAYKWTCSLELSAKTALIARQAETL